MSRRPSARGLQDIAAMNARTYAMSPVDREQWYLDHPVSEYEAALMLLGDDGENVPDCHGGDPS